jgi:hypothetical protein
LQAGPDSRPARTQGQDLHAPAPGDLAARHDTGVIIASPANDADVKAVYLGISGKRRRGGRDTKFCPQRKRWR